MRRQIFFICFLILILQVIAAPSPKAVPAEDHEYFFEDWRISATDFSSLKKIEMAVDDCEFKEPISCAAQSAQPKPATSFESSGLYISHCGDRARVTAATRPCYPKLARLARAAGVVAVLVVVGKEGKVVWARAVSGHPLLWAASVRAACQWQFERTDYCPVVNRIISFRFIAKSTVAPRRINRVNRAIAMP